MGGNGIGKRKCAKVLGGNERANRTFFLPALLCAVGVERFAFLARERVKFSDNHEELWETIFHKMNIIRWSTLR